VKKSPREISNITQMPLSMLSFPSIVETLANPDGIEIVCVFTLIQSRSRVPKLKRGPSSKWKLNQDLPEDNVKPSKDEIHSHQSDLSPKRNSTV
jgi:hypothetical protein